MAHIHSKPFIDANGNRNGVVLSFRIIDEEVAAEDVARDQIAARDDRNRGLTLSLARFGGICATAARNSAWTLDTLVEALKAGPDSGGSDDCTLVRLHVD